MWLNCCTKGHQSTNIHGSLPLSRNYIELHQEESGVGTMKIMMIQEVPSIIIY